MTALKDQTWGTRLRLSAKEYDQETKKGPSKGAFWHSCGSLLLALLPVPVGASGGKGARDELPRQ